MAESSDDEDVPVATLGKSQGEALPAAPAVATPSSKDSDSEDDVVGGVRGRLAQKRAVQAAPEVNDDLDDLVEEDTVVAPGPLKSRLKKGSQAKPAEPSKPPNLKKTSAIPKNSEKPPKASKPRMRAKLPKIADAPPEAVRGAGDVSDSEDELISGFALPNLAQAEPAASKQSEAVPPTGASGDGDGSDSDDSNPPSSASGSDKDYRGAPPSRAKKARRRGGSDSESDSDSSDESDDGLSLKSKGKQKKPRASKEKKAKPRKRSPFSETEDEADDPPLDVEALRGKFSDKPKKEVDVKKLTSQSFLIGSAGRKSSWKLPIFDNQQRVNLHLLHHARQVVTTGMLHPKKKAPYIITDSVKARVEKYWKEAKLWHRTYGRSPELAAAAKPARSKSADTGEAAAAGDASDDEGETLDALLKTSGSIVANPDDEGETLDALLQQSSGSTAAKPKAAKRTDSDESDSDASDAPARRKQRGDDKDDPSYEAEDGAEDEEEAMLKVISEQHTKQKIKDRFWTREAGFINDEEGEESDEGEGEGGEVSGAESEALEGNERGKDPFKPHEMGRMNDKEWAYYNQQVHSETQRLLRKQQAALPCRKEKTLELGDVLSKIQQRCSEVSAEKSQPAEASLPMAEEEQEVRCLHCGKMITDGDDPVIDRLASATVGDDGAAAPIFCSNLCLTLHRQATADEPAKVPQALRQQSFPHLADDSDDDLVVLPSAPKTRAAESKKQLRGVMKLSAGAANPRARLGLINQLKDSACERKREEARTSGKFEEEEELAFAGCFVPTLHLGEMDEQGESDVDGDQAGHESDKEQDDEASESEAAGDVMDDDDEEGEAGQQEEGEPAGQQDAGQTAPSADDCLSKEESGAVDVQGRCGDETPMAGRDPSEPVYRSVAPALPEIPTEISSEIAPAAPAAPPTSTADAIIRPANKDSHCANAFGKRGPQQSKLGFAAHSGGTSADAVMSGEQSDLAVAAEQEANTDGCAETHRGLVDSEALHSGEESGGEELGSADEVGEAADDVDDLIVEDAGEEEDEASRFQLQAELAAQDDERETEAVLRGLKRKHGAKAVQEGGRSAGDVLDLSNGVDADEAEDKEDDASENDELRSLDDFIAEDGEEVDVYAQPPVQEDDDDDEEDQTLKLIRDKFGDHWVCGDDSQPAIEDDEDDSESKARAVRNALKRRRQAAAESQESQNSAASFFGRDEKSQSMWVMLADSRSQPSSAPPPVKRLASASSSGENSTPRIVPVQRSMSSAAALPTTSAVAAGGPAAGEPPQVRRFGSFADKGRYGSDKLGRLGGGAAGSATKGFVFQQGSENSQGAQQGSDLRTEVSSRHGKSAASAIVKQGTSRAPLGGGMPNAGAAVSRGPSLLTRVLGGSKNWKKQIS